MITQHAVNLKKFREKLYRLFVKRNDAVMNLLDALTAHGHEQKSIVQLSECPEFERQYSSITDAISDGLTQAPWKKIMRLHYRYGRMQEDESAHRFILDCTSNARPFASKLADRMITHSPNPAPGNKPICVGHPYSVLTLLPHDRIAENKHWLVPMLVQRVTSRQKGHEVGMEQLTDCMEELGLTDKLCISLGDSLYGTQFCRESAAKHENLVHIFRLNSARNIYLQPSQHDVKEKGRHKEFGEKMKLNEQANLVPPDREDCLEWVTAKGKKLWVTLRCWDNSLLRGSRKFRASQHPFNLIQIIARNSAGENVFKRPLWLAVLGKRRHEISLNASYIHYKARYDIEHFFRFGKSKLLMDKYQTPDVEHEAHWWNLCLTAYMLLFLGKEIVPKIPKAWERYLPEYKQIEVKKTVATPTQTQRGYGALLKTIGTPAKECVVRGIACGRSMNETQIKRTCHPIIFKNQPASSTPKPIVLGSEKTQHLSNPETIETLRSVVQARLKKMKIPVAEFAKMLLDTG